VPLTDEAPIDWRIFRHGDLLTVLMVATDPVYLAEPEIVSKSFRLSRTPLDYRAGCVTGYEGREPGGHPATLYPEYRKTIKDSYVPPPPCTESCGVAGNFVVRR
jgi:hypothetical protein